MKIIRIGPFDPIGMLTGWLYCFLWYSSILAGYCGLYCPLLPLLLLSNRLYRYCTDILFTYWQYYPTALLEILCGCQIEITGDRIQTNEMSILIMNHRTRTDWNFIWPTVYHSIIGTKRYQYSTKFILKDIIRHIPGPGWVMQLACFIYIKRCWHQDLKIFEKFCNYINDLSYKCSILLFPEGTDLTIKTKQSSDEYAKRNNFKIFNHLLYPRTTGFIYLIKTLQQLKHLDAVYDLTLIYLDRIPQTEFVLLKGQFPKRIKIHLKRYDLKDLPETNEQLKEFLLERWQEKERILKEFHQNGHFLFEDKQQQQHQIIKKYRNYYNELIVALLFWSCLPFIVFYLLIISKFYRIFIVLHTIFLLLLNILTNGFQQFEIDLFNFKRRIWKTICPKK